MAGTVMHLVIADRLLEKLNIDNVALFFCGNLAPDAIMAREYYEREMKNHTHFKDGQKPYTFRIAENQVAYRERLFDFAKQFLKKNDPMYELYLGYIVHILVDELYLLTFYEDVLVELEKNGIAPDDPQFCKRYVSDVDRVDFELVKIYPFHYPMPKILLRESGYEIPGWITSEELENSKQFIIQKNFLTNHVSEPLEVMSFEKNKAYMDLCVNRIPQMLTDLLQNIGVMDTQI